MQLGYCNRVDEAVITHTFDLDAIRNYRETWGVYRDRRPELYGTLQTMDGQVTCPLVLLSRQASADAVGGDGAPPPLTHE